MGKLQLQVDQRVQDLQQALAKEEQTFQVTFIGASHQAETFAICTQVFKAGMQVQLEVLEAHASDVQSSLLQMDTDIGQIGHSTRLGDRIQVMACCRCSTAGV